MISINLDDCINFLLTTAQHKVFILMKNELSKYDITPIQYAVMNCINNLDLYNSNEIAAYLSIENSTMSGIVDRMEKKELLFKKSDPSDRRCLKLELTEKSLKMFDEIIKSVEDFNDSIFAMFNKNEQKDLKKFLKRLSTL